MDQTAVMEDWITNLILESFVSQTPAGIVPIMQQNVWCIQALVGDVLVFVSPVDVIFNKKPFEVMMYLQPVGGLNEL